MITVKSSSNTFAEKYIKIPYRRCIINSTTIIIGALAIAYGIFTAVMRVVKPTLFKKLEPMKQRWGEKMGNVIHFTGYVVIPVVAGVALILAGTKGASLFKAF